MALRVERIPTLADNYQLTVDHPPIIVADPQAASKDLLLPLASTAAGLVFIVVNIADAPENIVVKDSTDTTTIATVAQTESVVLVCDGVSWYGLVGANT